MHWPWLILHLILLSSLPAQYSLATTSGFSLAHMNQAASIFNSYPLPPEDSCLPAPLQLLAQGGDQGHWVRNCFLFLAQFWGISNVPTGLSLSPFRALPQGKMLSRHTLGIAFFRNQHWGIHGKPTTNCLRSSLLRGQWGCRCSYPAPLWAHAGQWEGVFMIFYASRCVCLFLSKLRP